MPGETGRVGPRGEKGMQGSAGENGEPGLDGKDGGKVSRAKLRFVMSMHVNFCIGRLQVYNNSKLCSRFSNSKSKK